MMMLSRRQALKLTVAALLVVGGCARFSRRTDLDTAINDLNELLDDIAANGEQIWLASIARRIEIRARDLLAEHSEFVSSFDALLTTYDVTEVQLMQVIEAHSMRREWLRNDLLRLQDELHASISQEDWGMVIKVLNRTGNAITTQPFAEV